MKHIDVARYIAGHDDTSVRERDRAHLATCASCRTAVDALVRAERVLGGNTEVLSTPERDAVLERVLATVAPGEALVPQTTPSLSSRVLAWCKRGWPVLVPAAAAAAALLLVVRDGRDGRDDRDDGAFVARSAGHPDAPIAAFCVQGDTVHIATAAAPCHDDDEVVLRVQVSVAATVHVFGDGLRSDHAPPLGAFVAANTETVLESSWRRHGEGPAVLTVVACSACDRLTAEQRAGAAQDAKLDGVWHIVVPWAAP